ncbi:MAG: hypothetical protein AAFQ89_13780 [Cyanobacteria bacterium J06626_18]
MQPFSSSQWSAIDAWGHQVDDVLQDEETRSRFTERFVPLQPGTVPSPFPSLVIHLDMPMTLGLRLLSQKTKK